MNENLDLMGITGEDWPERLDASDLIKAVLDDLRRFTEAKEAEDDRTIVVAKVK